MKIDPEQWLVAIATVPSRIADGKTTENVTPWFSGNIKPAYVGFYDRIFTDGVYRMYWDGIHWRAKMDYPPHWRQVGDYPAWRGLAKKPL